MFPWNVFTMMPVSLRIEWKMPMHVADASLGKNNKVPLYTFSCLPACWTKILTCFTWLWKNINIRNPIHFLEVVEYQNQFIDIWLFLLYVFILCNFVYWNYNRTHKPLLCSDKSFDVLVVETFLNYISMISWFQAGM